ncbi:hypothetical protein NC651_029127 [Populus alba x Populus x berolinensis]|nr:hypothetical protein NC651_029127 [Populus alba x Populus x berolinensis]
MKPKPHKKTIKNHFQKPPAAAENPSDYAFKITKTAVSQICQSVGFKTTQLSALETLTHVATLFLQTLAKTAVLYSNASSRTQSNIFDIINSLHDMSSVRGFTGGSTLHCNISGISLLRSSVFKNIKSFVEFSDEIPSYNKCGDRCEKKRKGELVLWEKSDLVGGGIGSGDEFQGISWENQRRSGGGGGGDLAVERGRVRFRIGEVGGAQKGGVLISLLPSVDGRI